MAKLKGELETAKDELSKSKAEVAKVTAQLAGERALRDALVAEATANARDSMRAEVAAAFKDGINTAKSLFSDAKCLYKN